MGNTISVQSAISQYSPYRPASLSIVAQKLGMNSPVALTNLVGTLNALPKTMSFSQVWTTPSGTPLGGTITLNVNIDGTYKVEFQTITNSHVLGLSFDFQLRAYLTAPGMPCLFFYHAGSVGTNLTKTGEDDHVESGSNALISMYWNQIVNSATFSTGHDYKWAGPVGTITDLVSELLDIGAGALGAAVGAVIGLTQEAIGWLGTSLGPGGTIGVIAGVAVFAVGAIAGLGVGTALILGTVAGVAAGAVTNALIQYRPMTPEEILIAQQVFKAELPYANVVLTNLAGLNGRAFTAPGVDGKTYCNLGENYNATLGPGNGAYPARGELMIHELTHAWQIAHNSFVPGFVCSGVVNQTNYVMGDDIYAYGPAGPGWSTFNLEQQGAIVNQWFGGEQTNNVQMDPASAYYQYITGNILTGSAGYSTSWL
jgi:hypothetical protein